MPTGGGTLKNTSNGLRTAAFPFPYPAAGGPSLPPSTTQSLPVSRRRSEGEASATRSRSMTRSTTAVRRALSEGDGPGREKRRALDPLVLDATILWRFCWRYVPK